MSTPRPDKTIDQLFEEFLADQEARLSPKTYDQVRGDHRPLPVVPGDATGPVTPGRITTRSPEAKGTYCGTYGAEDITSGFSEFLDYFMPHKVIAGNETMKAAGTVIKKLARWLVEKGYTEDDESIRDTGRRDRTRPARQPEAPGRPERLARRDRAGPIRQGARRPFPHPAGRAETDLAGVAALRRVGDRPDPGPREGRQGLQGRLGRRRRGRPDPHRAGGWSRSGTSRRRFRSESMRSASSRTMGIRTTRTPSPAPCTGGAPRRSTPFSGSEPSTVLLWRTASSLRWSRRCCTPSRSSSLPNSSRSYGRWCT